MPDRYCPRHTYQNTIEQYPWWNCYWYEAQCPRLVLRPAKSKKKRWQNNTYRYRIRIRFVWQGRFFSPACLTSPSTCILQWRIQGRGPGGAAPLLFLDQTEAQRAGKNFFGDELPLISGSKWPAPPPPPPPLIWRSGSAIVLWKRSPKMHL